MSRKFLQMGYTRARRYANHKSGQKYKENPQKILDPEASKEARKNVLTQQVDWKDNEKALAAEIFKQKWDLARVNPTYLEQMKLHKERYEKKVV